MNDLLKKMAIALLKTQLSTPEVRTALHAYVDGQVDSELDSVATQISGGTGFAGVALKVLASELKDPTIRTELHTLIDSELGQLIGVLVSKLA